MRIRARSSSAPPPKELRSLFRTAGEMNAVRAARVMSSLQSAGVQPARVTIVGDAADKSAPRAPPRGKKGGAPPRRRSRRARVRARRVADVRERRGSLGAAALLVLLACSLTPSSAAAYDFSVDLRTIGQGYQVRRFARRRQQRAAVAAPAHAIHGPERVRHRARAAGAATTAIATCCTFDASLRFDSDFGGYMLGRPTGSRRDRAS